jgi:hypothetical protein
MRWGGGIIIGKVSVGVRYAVLFARDCRRSGNGGEGARSREASRSHVSPWEGEGRKPEQPDPSKKARPSKENSGAEAGLQSLVATSRNTLGWRAIILSNVTAAPEG